MNIAPTPENVRSVGAFLYFVQERDTLRLEKQNHPQQPPWTNDPILQKYKFTNIRRQDDRGTRWIIEHLIEPYGDRPGFWFTLLIARLINWPPTLRALLNAEVIPCAPEHFNAELFVRVIEEHKAAGGKVYTGAYMVYPGKVEGLKNKAEFLAYSVLRDAGKLALAIKYAETSGFISLFVHELSKIFGVSTFIAGQVAADLTYTPEHELSKARDLYTYAPLGPGSQKGLNYVYGHAPGHLWTQEGFNYSLIRLNTRVRTNLGIMDLTLHDVQNCCCEFSKYARTVLGEGKPKTIYNLETEF